MLVNILFRKKDKIPDFLFKTAKSNQLEEATECNEKVLTKPTDTDSYSMMANNRFQIEIKPLNDMVNTGIGNSFPF